jgi:ATP-dependent DNA helicase
MYHGSPEERAELRRTVMSLSHKPETSPNQKPVRTKKRRLSRRRDFDSDEESLVIVEPEEERDIVPEDDDANLTNQRLPNGRPFL